MYEVAFAGGNPDADAPIEIRDAEHMFTLLGPLTKPAARELASHLVAACDYADCMIEAERAAIAA